MNRQQIQGLIHDAIDREFILDGLEKGITEEDARQRLAADRRVANLYDGLIESGYSDAQIDALWAGKTPQEILADFDANGTASTPLSPNQIAATIS